MKFQLERILLFSDAVFAIAITLMIIEIKPPHLEHGSTFLQGLNAFLIMSPTIIGTVLSFYLIGLFWYRHHDLMKHLVGCDKKFINLNLSLLLSIAFLPFSTAFVFENEPAPFPLLIYNMNYAIATYFNYKIYAYAFNPKHNLTSSDVSHEIIKIRRESIFSTGIYVLTSTLAFFTPLAPIGYSLFALQQKFANRKTAVTVTEES
ncbi:TMEM175 family protein [Flavobacterium wongokense]|uniref:TMEM175 family protein n=1 Tax=Flavobacterium wongokense TaxID=2910674 RepID=UPI001F403324|nr:TMEM175 family protein [Flavobacterium sp. WG47]MCF6132973.1 TMEM175 family protein [Flavobacterium sp. WG47]